MDRTRWRISSPDISSRHSVPSTSSRAFRMMQDSIRKAPRLIRKVPTVFCQESLPPLPGDVFRISSAVLPVSFS